MRNDLTIPTTIETIPSYVVAEMMDKKHKEVLYMIEGNESRGIIGIKPVIEQSAELHLADYFIESEYNDRGRMLKCYECTKMGCELLSTRLNGSKGIMFATKYVKAFNDMKQQLITQQPLALPNYSFSNYWIKREIASMKPTDIPDYIDNLLEHIKLNKASDRLTTYEVARNALQDLQPTFTEAWQREMVQASLNKLHNLIELQKTYINRADKGAKTKKINQLEQENEQLREENNQWQTYTEELEEYYNPPRVWTTIDYHGFTYNKMYHNSHKTPLYNWWIDNFPVDQVPTKEEYELYQGIDFTKPIGIDLHFVKVKEYDTDNLVKSALDMIFNRILGVDDNIVIRPVPQTVGYCNSTDDGKIIFAIYNIDVDM